MTLSSADIERFERYFQQQFGLIFAGSRHALMLQSLTERLNHWPDYSADDYLHLLQHDEEERATLISGLVINESFFFREIPYLDMLMQAIIPERQHENDLRILSAGCSTGDEIYTLSILLQENYEPELINRITLYGVDIDRQALAVARKGIYTTHAFRNLPQNIQEKYFHPQEDNRFAIKDSIKKNIHFQRLNLASYHYPEFVKNLDVIFYRNVSIYFDSETQARIFHKLSRALKPGGVLIMGASEIFSHSAFLNQQTLLHKEEWNNHVFFRRIASDDGSYQPTHTIRNKPHHTTISQPIQSQSQTTQKQPHQQNRLDVNHRAETSLEQAKAWIERRRLLEAIDELEHIDQVARRYLEAMALRAALLFHLNKTAQTIRLCQTILEYDPLHQESHALLALAAWQNSDLDTMMRHFLRVVRINESHWLGHYYLAKGYMQRKETSLARHEFEKTLACLQEQGIHHHGISFFPLSFSEAQLTRMCQKQIARLT
ncbi:CheR family methyltransferase [Magnetococcales bacterium HHB-1]